MAKVKKRQEIFVGAKIRQLRKERNVTQAELAQKIDVQQSDLCRMENGEYKVSLETLFKILSIFEINIAEFFKDEKRAGLSNDECEILRLFNSLDERSKLEVLEFLKFKKNKDNKNNNHAIDRI